MQNTCHMLSGDSIPDFIVRRLEWNKHDVNSHFNTVIQTNLHQLIVMSADEK